MKQKPVSRSKTTEKLKLPAKTNSIPHLRLPGFMDFADDFLLSMERDGASMLTVQNYRYHLKWFFHFLNDNGLPTDLADITESHASQYIVVRRRGGMQQSTLAVVVSVLRSFFAWAKQQDFIVSNPLEKIKKPRPDKKTMPIFSPEQVAAMIEVWPAYDLMGERNRTILLLLYDTGMRVGELVDLRAEAVDLKAREILIEHGKGRKQRIVGLGEKTRGQLYRWVTQFRPQWAQDDRYVFINRKGKPMTRRDVWIMVQRSGHAAGIEGVRLSPHVLRHSCATGLVADGVDISDLQVLLGHEDIATTARYLHPHPKAVAERHKAKALGDKLKLKLR